MEDVLIPVVIFSALLLFVKMILDYSRFKHEHKAGSRVTGGDRQSNTVSVSELEDLINGAVQHAVEPLERRLRRVERGQLSGRDDTRDAGEEIESAEFDPPISSRGGNVYDVGAVKPRVRRH